MSTSIPALRAATVFLVLHAALSVFSAFALTTFLSGAPPSWLQRPDSQVALEIGWRFGPATTVVCGALAALLHAVGKLGARSALSIFTVAFVLALGAELLGTATGYPFGPYEYTPILGYRIAGLVPFNIPTSWFYMMYASLAICGRILSPVPAGASSSQTNRHGWRWAITAGAVFTAWDIAMDPAMVKTSHWLWQMGPVEQQTLLERIFVSDIFYGMPLLNWFGWLLTGTLIARLMIWLVPTRVWTGSVSTSRFPLVLYAVNGVLPIAICIRYGLVWAALLGAIGMLLPLALALRPAERAAVGQQALRASET